ncbi:MAG: hypothetical protein LBS07_03045 [Prevotellaceae bacterium]|jgi:hypothetical protein|nr:hypothetical protein [Prevotellaceae bacterium]
METILYITIPALLVLLTAYLLIDKLLKNDERRRNFELRKNNLSQVTPVRLRAYERLALLLERTMPNTLVLNVVKPDMTCFDLQRELLSTVRQEFGHNASQQIYVSARLWEAVKATQESLLRLINMCASKCPPDAKASALAEMIVQVYSSSEQTPSETTLGMLKKEVQLLM